MVSLDGETLKYQGNILKIYEDTVLANGHEPIGTISTMTELRPCYRRQRMKEKSSWCASTETRWASFTLEIPAGKLDDPKEPKIECAYRELEEETGFKTEKLEYLISVNTTVAFCDEAIDIFVAHNLVPAIRIWTRMRS